MNVQEGSEAGCVVVFYSACVVEKISFSPDLRIRLTHEDVTHTHKDLFVCEEFRVLQTAPCHIHSEHAVRSPLLLQQRVCECVQAYGCVFSHQ